MKKRRVRRNRRKSPLSFQKLEPRQLLAGDLAAAHQVSFELPAGADLVSNGDFETLTAGSDNLYNQSEVEGWQASDNANGQELQIFNYSSDYGSVIDLDSTVEHFDQVFQDIDTVSGRQYVLSFDFRAHPSANPDPTDRTYDFEIWWGGQLEAVYTGGDFWQTGAVIVDGIGDATEVLFGEISEGDTGGGDGIGALLDNIRLVELNDAAVTNGSFETTESGTEQFFRPFQVAGWGAMGADLETRLIKVEDSSVGSSLSASLGDYYLNLDTTATQRDIVFQDLDTVAGATYYVTFDVRGDGPQDNGADELRVRWNNAWASTIHTGTDWQKYGLMLEADSDLTRLTFLEPGGGNNGDGSGPLIDNVQLHRVDLDATNSAPEIDQFDNQTIDFATAAEFDIVASDVNNHSLTYTLAQSGVAAGQNLPTIDADSGRISYLPSSSGNVDITVTATDELGASDEMTFQITVGEFDQFAGDGVLSALAPALRNNIYTEAPDIAIDTTKEFEARFTTTEGTFSINLFPDESPETVNNFVLLARDGYYDGIDFHRVIEGFMSQSGDPLQTGTGGPGYTFADETDSRLSFDRGGYLAMANRGADTNGSQFFITFEPTLFLDGNHTIFGEIVGDDSAFRANTITHTPVAGQEIPIDGITKTKIQSITIHVTDPATS